MPEGTLKHSNVCGNCHSPATLLSPSHNISGASTLRLYALCDSTPPRGHYIAFEVSYVLTLLSESHGRYSGALQWRHNERDVVSNHQRLLLKRFFRRISKKTSKFYVTALCEEDHRWLVYTPHKGPVTRKIFPFDDVIMGKRTKEAHNNTMDHLYKQ